MKRNLTVLIFYTLLAFHPTGNCQSLVRVSHNNPIGSTGYLSGAKNLSVDVDETDGDIVVVWQEKQTGGTADIWMVYYDKNYVPKAGTWPQQVNYSTPNDQILPHVKINQTTGDVAVTWIGKVGSGNIEAYGRVFNSSGAALSPYATADKDLSSNTKEKFVVFSDFDASGNLFVAFSAKESGGKEYVYANKLVVSSGALSTDALVNSSSQDKVNVLTDAEWDPVTTFVIGWHSFNTNSSQMKVKASLVNASLTNTTGEVQVDATQGQYELSLDVHQTHHSILFSWTKRQATEYLIKANVMEVTGGGSGLGVDIASFVVAGGTANTYGYNSRPVWAELSGHFIIAYDFITTATEVQSKLFKYCYNASGSSSKAQEGGTYIHLSLSGQYYFNFSFDIAFSKTSHLMPIVWEQNQTSGSPPPTRCRGDIWFFDAAQSYAVMNGQDDPNLYPSRGNLFFISYTSREIPENLTFDFYEDYTPTPNVMNVGQTTIVGPNKFAFDVSALVNNKTYLISIKNAKGETEYIRMIKTPNPACAGCQGCQ